MRLAPICIAAFLAGVAAAQPASDLLQSAIYHQETVGDLDGAIRIYRQILNSGAPLRAYMAEAQYRLGACLLRKGDTAAGTQAMQTVIRDYSHQERLVALAREALPLGPRQLLSIPWSAIELTEYRWTIPGVTDGWSISRVAPSPKNSRHLRIQMSFYSPYLNVTMVETDRDTMAATESIYRGPSAQNARTPEGAGLVRQGSVLVRQGAATTVRPATQINPGAAEQPLDNKWGFGGKTSGDRFYAQGELFYVLRRLPLAPGWSSRLYLQSPEKQVITGLTATVAGVEGVTVPAGTFQCYKVRLTDSPDFPPPHHSLMGLDWPRTSAGETLWYGIDGARPLVKIESGNAIGELASLRNGDPAGTTSYRDSQVGYSFTLPIGWIYHPRTSFTSPSSSVDLLDPQAQVWVTVSGRSMKTDPAQIEATLVTMSMQRTQTTGARGYKLRGAVRQTRIGGHAALSWTADLTDGGVPRVEYGAAIVSEAARVSILVRVDAPDFDGFMQRFRPVIDSFRMP